jgi:hypothetical protein
MPGAQLLPEEGLKNMRYIAWVVGFSAAPSTLSPAEFE